MNYSIKDIAQKTNRTKSQISHLIAKKSIPEPTNFAGNSPRSPRFYTEAEALQIIDHLSKIPVAITTGLDKSE